MSSNSSSPISITTIFEKLSEQLLRMKKQQQETKQLHARLEQVLTGLQGIQINQAPPVAPLQTVVRIPLAAPPSLPSNQQLNLSTPTNQHINAQQHNQMNDVNMIMDSSDEKIKLDTFEEMGAYKNKISTEEATIFVFKEMERVEFVLPSLTKTEISTMITLQKIPQASRKFDLKEKQIFTLQQVRANSRSSLNQEGENDVGILYIRCDIRWTFDPGD